MAGIETNTCSQDNNLVFIKVDDNTLKSVAKSLAKIPEDAGEEYFNEKNDSGCGSGRGEERGTLNTPPGFSKKASPNQRQEDYPYKYTFKNMQPNNNNSNNSSDKILWNSLDDLSQTVERIMAMNCCVGEDWRSPDISYMGVSAALGEMLLQHGEFPATPGFTPMPRYRSTPIGKTQPRNLGESSSVTEGQFNNGFLSCTAASYNSQEKHTFVQGFGDANYGLSDERDKRWAPLGNSVSITPENLQQDMSSSSLPSGISWRLGDGEGPCSSLSSCYSSSSSIFSSRDSNKHYTSPTERLNACLRPQLRDPSFGRVKSAPKPVLYQEWQPEVMPLQLPYVNTTASYHTLATDTAAHHTHAKPEVVGDTPTKHSPRRAFIKDVVLKESVRAFRSHPLFPLLKELALADYYFDKASFSVAALLPFLPTSVEELVWQYRKKHQGVAQGSTYTLAVDSVILDTIVYAHASLLDKVSSHAARMSASVESEGADVDGLVEEMFQRYVGVVHSSTPLHILQASDAESFTTLSSSDAKDGERSLDPNQQFECLLTTSFSPILPSSDDCRSSPASRDAKEVLIQWLMEHQNNPYPDDDQKLLLVQRTGCTANQIDQWFANARRRLLVELRPDVAKE